MIRHIVVFRFKNGVDDRVKEKLIDEYNSFPAKFPSMHNFSFGKNISERDNTFEYGFCVEFENEGALKSYLSSKEHEEHVVERFRPVIESRAIFSYKTQN
jgi:hypothetical protein